MKIAEIERYLVDYSSISSGNKIRFEKLRAVLSPMQKAGIDCILLKGADLIPRLYGVLGVRPLGDADLLVHEADLPALDQVLTRLGYRPQIDGNPAYVDPDNILALDIITSVWYVDDEALLWQRSVPRGLQDVQVKGLGASDLLIYLTAYNVIHRGCLSASFARDIAFLVEKEDIDARYFERPYYIVPQDAQAAEGYVVIREALKKMNRLGVGQVTMSGREYLVSVGPVGKGLVMEIGVRPSRRQVSGP